MSPASDTVGSDPARAPAGCSAGNWRWKTGAVRRFWLPVCSIAQATIHGNLGWAAVGMA